VKWSSKAIGLPRAKLALTSIWSRESTRNQDPAPNEPWLWGDTVYQGVQVYDVSLENGFVLRGEITQIPSGDDIWNDWNKQINRVLFIGSDLFTLSDAEVKVNDLTTLADKVSLELPALPDLVVIEPAEGVSTEGVK
jgi:hypothetical protein